MTIPHLPKWRRLAAKPVPAETPSERRAKYVYQLLLIVSVVANVVLAIRGQWANERLNDTNKEKTQLEKLKITLEAELLREKNTPTLIVSRLQYASAMFDAQLKRENLLPFLQNTKDVRIVDNDVLNAFIKDKRAASTTSARQGVVTFLVIANISSVNAYQVTSRAADGSTVQLGDLMASAAILIPTAYTAHTGAVKSAAQNPVVVQFQAGSNSAFAPRELAIPAAVAQSWTPTAASIRGIGRASEGKQDTHILDVLPGK